MHIEFGLIFNTCLIINIFVDTSLYQSKSGDRLIQFNCLLFLVNLLFNSENIGAFYLIVISYLKDLARITVSSRA